MGQVRDPEGSTQSLGTGAHRAGGRALGQLGAGGIPVPDWQRDLIRDRLAALEDVPLEERSVPWDAVRKRIFSDKT